MYALAMGAKLERPHSLAYPQAPRHIMDRSSDDNVLQLVSENKYKP
jgi:hypothetical protein